jgi:uncharacterized membrane protein
MGIVQHPRRRALLKAVTYRALGTLITAGCTWLVTGEAIFAASVGTLDAVAKIGGYYLHERLWDLAESPRTSIPLSPVSPFRRRITHALGFFRSR